MTLCETVIPICDIGAQLLQANLGVWHYQQSATVTFGRQYGWCSVVTHTWSIDAMLT